MTKHEQDPRKQASILLPYYKQGDDIQGCIDQCDNLDDALEIHAQYMDSGARQLRDIKNAIDGHDVKISAGANCIFIEGNAELIDLLVKDDLACGAEFVEEAEPERDSGGSASEKHP